MGQNTGLVREDEGLFHPLQANRQAHLSSVSPAGAGLKRLRGLESGLVGDKKREGILQLASIPSKICYMPT